MSLSKKHLKTSFIVVSFELSYLYLKYFIALGIVPVYSLASYKATISTFFSFKKIFFLAWDQSQDERLPTINSSFQGKHFN